MNKINLSAMLCVALIGRAAAADVVQVRVNAVPAALGPSGASLAGPSLTGPAPALSLLQPLAPPAILEAAPALNAAAAVDAPSAAPARVAAAYANHPSLKMIQDADPKNAEARAVALDYAFEKRSGGANGAEVVAGKPSHPAALQAAASRLPKARHAAERTPTSSSDQKPGRVKQILAKIASLYAYVLFNRVVSGMLLILGLIMATSSVKLTLLDLSITAAVILAPATLVVALFYFLDSADAVTARQEVQELTALLDKKKPELMKIPGVKEIQVKPAVGWGDDGHWAYGVIIVDHLGPDNYDLLPKKDPSVWFGNPEEFDRLGSIDGWPIAIKIVP